MRKRQRLSNRIRYARLRKKKIHLFGLHLRLVVFVTIEMLVAVAIGYVADLIINDGILWLLNTYVLSRFLPFEIYIPLWVHLIVSCLSVGIIATTLLSLWTFMPVRNLKKSIQRIADGDFSVRITAPSTSYEVQEIYSGFNVMAEELESTEILQTEFVSNVSHEFKTPINAIEGYSMLLQDNDNLNEDQREYVEKILINTQRLSSLTGSILLLSKIENKSIPTDREYFKLDEQIRETIVALEPVWDKKRIELDVDIADIEYYGCEKLMYHVWSNLIGNALKFGPVGGTVNIKLYDDKKKIYFVVEDEGEGISEEAMKHVFDKFYQADSSHKEEGHGLGLALVKKILILEEGEIKAENREEGGCRFTVVLQKKKLKRDRKEKKSK